MNHECALLQRERCVATESVREQERQRLAQNLNDNLSQHLLVLHMNLVKLCGNINQKQHDLQGDASLVMRQLGIVFQSLLTLISGLRPGVLGRGFCSAVEWQCEQFSTRKGIPCHLVAWSSVDINLPKPLSLLLFRAFQEALNNVQQHSKASCAYVILNSDENTAVVTIVDDGVGITLDNQEESNLYQLAGLRERIIDQGGKVKLCSAHKSGVALNIELPLGGRWS